MSSSLYTKIRFVALATKIYKNNRVLFYNLPMTTFIWTDPVKNTF